MPVTIGGVIREGFERTAARNGLAFVGILFALGILRGSFARSLWPWLATSEASGFGGTMQYAPSLGTSPPVAGVSLLVLTVASFVVSMAAIRTFVGDETERLPAEHFTRNVVLAVVNLLVGTVVFGVVVAAGSALLVVPGLFLLVSLFFWNVYVVVEDRNFVDGMRSSWSLTRGHRWRLLLLGFVVVIITAVVNVVSGLPGAVLPRPIAFVVAQTGAAFAGVFATATVARTYCQLVALDAGVASGESSDEVAAA